VGEVISHVVVADLFPFPKLLLYCLHQAQAEEAHLAQVYLAGEVVLLSTQIQLVLLLSPMAKAVELISISPLEKLVCQVCKKRDHAALDS
jgi:hypothetical protein